MSSNVITSLDSLFEEALKEGVFPGASLLVGSQGKVLYQGAWGLTRLDCGESVKPDTWFDLASCTKPLVTASLCIRAVCTGKVRLDDPLTRFFSNAILPVSKREITIRQLLSHSSGLPAYQTYYLDLIRIPPPRRISTLLTWILEAPLVDPPGRVCRYSDLGFILLGMILETAASMPLDEQATRFLFKPRGIEDLAFCRLDATFDPRIRPRMPSIEGRRFAATEDCPWRGRVLEGEVHDENAYCLGGVSGQAGLFGAAEGVFRWLSFLWRIHEGLETAPPWSSSVVQEFWIKQEVGSECSWTLGFDTPSGPQSSAGAHFSPRTIGHLGFTGTSFWMDLERDVIVILLTNRVHPTRTNEKIKKFRPLLHNTVMESLHELTK
jgi:CubicO group peptidase (beta-lactamase class C family)